MDELLSNLRFNLEKLYLKNSRTLQFHGWSHIQFVSENAAEFAKSVGANVFLTQSAALVHDLNYIVKANSEASKGAGLREQVLTQSGYSKEEITKIEKIIVESDNQTRDETISLEAKCLSDGDNAFKALPITPLMTGIYLSETKASLKDLAIKIVSEQKPLFDRGIYFYTDQAKSLYLEGATVNLKLWELISRSLEDPKIKTLTDAIFK